MEEGEEGMLDSERRQWDEIRQLDMEELQIEEVDGDFNSSSDDDGFLGNGRGDKGAGPSGGFTFNTCLASLHTYLGEVDDTHGRLSFLEGGAILNLPMFYLQGVVLFPEATLPLRVIEDRFIASVEKALHQVEAPCTIGVLRVYKHPYDARLCFSSVGTTAEIRQYRRLDDGTVNVVARGHQRFRLRRHWIDVEGAPCGEVQIVEGDIPLRTPKDAFSQLASITIPRKYTISPLRSSNITPIKKQKRINEDEDWEFTSPTSITSDYDHSPYSFDESSSGDESIKRDVNRKVGWDSSEESPLERKTDESEKGNRVLPVNKPRQGFRAPMTYWPRWVYDMYDSYSLARRAADLWREIIVNPSMDEYVRKPELLSFYIASKLPLSESRRQELLEVDGISYRLRREIQLLKDFNHIRCKNCMTLIAKRSDMVVMSSDGLLNAYVNPHGYVHEVITVYNANGLSLQGHPVKEHSWFPGYAWTIANCSVCESNMGKSNMGWLFTATRKNLLPKSFWGIRSSQVADDTQAKQR